MLRPYPAFSLDAGMLRPLASPSLRWSVTPATVQRRGAVAVRASECVGLGGPRFAAARVQLPHRFAALDKSMYNCVLSILFVRKYYAETNVAAQEAKAHACARLPGADENQGRAQGPEGKAGKRPPRTDRVAMDSAWLGPRCLEPGTSCAERIVYERMPTLNASAERGVLSSIPCW
jgi:hypothetical protein